MQPPEPAFWLAFEIENELVSVASTDLEVNEADDPDVQFLAGVARGFHVNGQVDVLAGGHRMSSLVANKSPRV